MMVSWHNLQIILRSCGPVQSILNIRAASDPEAARLGRGNRHRLRVSMGGLHVHTFVLDGVLHKFEFSVRLVLASARQLGLTISSTRRSQPCEAGLLWLADEALQHEYDEEQAEELSTGCSAPDPPLSEATLSQYQNLVDERRCPKHIDSRVLFKSLSTPPKRRSTSTSTGQASPRIRRRRRRLRFPTAVEGPLGSIAEEDEDAYESEPPDAEVFAAEASSALTSSSPSPSALVEASAPKQEERESLTELEREPPEPWRPGNSPMPTRSLMRTFGPPAPRALLIGPASSGGVSLLRPPPSRGRDDHILFAAAAKCREGRQKPAVTLRAAALCGTSGPGFSGRDDSIFVTAVAAASASSGTHRRSGRDDFIFAAGAAAASPSGTGLSARDDSIFAAAAAAVGGHSSPAAVPCF